MIYELTVHLTTTMNPEKILPISKCSLSDQLIYILQEMNLNKKGYKIPNTSTFPFNFNLIKCIFMAVMLFSSLGSNHVLSNKTMTGGEQIIRSI